ncbi:hypothetical protein ACWGQ5_44885 [Streptomyces sp. NPDC055722]
MTQARVRMIWGVLLAVLGAAVTIWTFLNGNGQIVIFTGGLAVGLAVFLSGYFWDRRIRAYLSRHGVPLEAVKGPRP